MKLASYLAQHRISFAEFGRRIAVSNAKVVERYAKEERIPEPPVMRRIAQETGNAVTANDFYGICDTAGPDQGAAA